MARHPYAHSRALRRLGVPFLALLAVPALSGCAALGALRTAAAPLETYTLTAAAAPAPAAATGRHVIVEPPAASGAIDTDRILVKPSPLQVQYLAGARWIDPVPELVQALLVESLQNTGAFRFVTRTTAGPFPDYTVLSEIIDFQAEATEDPDAPLLARVTLSVAVVREADSVIIASRRFEASRPAATADPPLVVGAFNTAADDVLGQTTAWILSLFGVRGGS
jgi:cholesterol transport system auxiliary component